MEKKSALSLFVFALLIITLIGFIASVQAARVPKGKLVSAYTSDPGSMDPMIDVSGSSWATFIIGVFEGMMWENIHTYEYEPTLAESWSILENGMVWEFKLRKGVKFQNGEPFNAEAVKFSVDRMLGRGEYDPKLKPKYKPRYRGIFNKLIEKLEVVDDYTVRYHMKARTAEVFPRFTYRFPMLPPKYIRKVGDADFAKKPIGTGTYQIVDRKIGESITLEANPEYWNKNPKRGQYGISYVKTVLQRLIPEDETRISALRVGEVDLAVNIPPHRAKSLETDPNIDIKYVNINSPNFVEINTAMAKDPKTGKANPWLDIRLRKAVTLAIDREALIKHIGTGHEKLHYLLTPGQLGFDSESAKKYSRYDPEQAKNLVREAGYPNGIDAVLHGMLGGSMVKEFTDAISGYLTAVGIRTKVVLSEGRSIIGKIRTKTLYPLMLWGGASGPEPLMFSRGAVSSGNAWGIHNGDPAMDKYITEAFAEFDPQKRGELYHKLFTYQAENVVFFAPTFCGVTITGIRSDKWTLEPSQWTRYPEYHIVKPIK